MSALSRVRNSRKRLRQVLDPFRREYDLIVLDSPATATLLAESIFIAADLVLIPVVPSTLAARAYTNLRGFVKSDGYDEDKMWPFFSMVEARKKMHRTTMAAMREQFPRWLGAMIPYAADVESMGLARAPLPAFMPAVTATKRYRELWREVGALLHGPAAPPGA